MINSNHPSSLGLHPIVYFYADSGSFRVSAFYAFVLFVIELDSRGKKNYFIKHRSEFEEIYYKYSSLVQLIARKKRSSINGIEANKDFFFEILNQLDKGTSKDEVMHEIIKKKEYNYLPSTIYDNSDITSRDFSSEKKSCIYIRDALINTMRCPICGGFLHCNAISIDHIERKEDGGNSSLENGQVTHPYCNTGYKN